MSNSKNSKVLIACPTLALSPDPHKWLPTLLSVINNVRLEGFDHATIFPYRLGWFEANNDIWNVAFEQQFDYILRLDDDVWGAPLNAFTQLLKADKDVVGAAYPNQRFPYFTVALNKVNAENMTLLEIWEKNICCLRSAVEAEHDTPIVKVDQIGFGMTLIKVDAFKYLERPIFKGKNSYPDDTYFAQLCIDNKIEQYVHFGVKLNHQHVTIDNAGFLFNADLLARSAEEAREKKELDEARK